MGVMHDRMHVLADQILGLPAQHAFGRRIDEGGLAVGIDAVDAFAGRAQDQLVLALDVAEEALDPLPFLDAAADIEVGFGIDRAAPLSARSLTSEAIAVRRRRPARCRNIRATSSCPRRGAASGRGVQYSPLASTASVNTISAGNCPGCSGGYRHVAQELRGHSRAAGRRQDWHPRCGPAPDRAPAWPRALASKMRPKSAALPAPARFSGTAAVIGGPETSLNS